MPKMPWTQSDMQSDSSIMKNNFYESLVTDISRSRTLTAFIKACDSFIVLICALSYPAFLVFITISDVGLERILCSIIVPAISFTIISGIRFIINEKRPYEIYDYTPIIGRQKAGKSFPSRHVFSVFMLAMTYMRFSCGAGIIFCFMGFLLGIIRVVGGVHYIHDVIAGAYFAVIFSAVYILL